MLDIQGVEVEAVEAEVENIHQVLQDKQEEEEVVEMEVVEMEETAEKKEKVVLPTGMGTVEMMEELDHLDRQIIIPVVQEILVPMVRELDLDNLVLQVMQDH
jgi:imidazoleglycerol phosphate synthase glutamine amidotransferase subunit HisH